MMSATSWMFAVPVLGFCTGLRTMTPVALICWYSHLGHLPLDGTWAFWLANPVAVGIFTLLAVGEYIGDKLPSTPARTALFPLISRLAFGGFLGAVLATSLRTSLTGGALLAIVAAAVGAFSGYYLRRYVVHTHRWPDTRVALVEDVMTLALSFLSLSAVTV